MEEDFKFNESNTEESTNTSEVNKKLTLIIISSVAVFFGLTVFIILTVIMNNKNKVNSTPVEIEITNKEVKRLYNMVTFTELGTRNDKFMKESEVTHDSFSNYEKYKYALSLAKSSDFVATGQTKNGYHEYSLDKNKMTNYIKTFFGNGITYSTNSMIEHTFNFKKDNNNTGNLKYYPDENMYKIYFTTTKEEIPDTMENKRYYTKLYKAEELNDELTLYEKIVYTKCSKNTTNTYNCLVFRDYDRTIQIDEVKGLDEDSDIKFDELKESNEIEYKFKKDIEGKYYFYSSKTNI